MGVAYLTSRILRRIQEGSFKVKVGSRTCLPTPLPSPASASLAVMWGLSGGVSPMYWKVAQYFLLGTPRHPLSSVTLSLPGRHRQVEVKTIYGRWLRMMMP